MRRAFSLKGRGPAGRWWRVGLVGAGVAALGVTAFVVALPSQAAVARADLYAAMPAGASGLEVHALDGATNYDTWTLHAATGKPRHDPHWKFVFGDANNDDVVDLYAINTKDNGGQNTAVHVYDGKSRYTRIMINQRLPSLGSTADAARYRFTAGDADGDGTDDLFVVDGRDNAGRNTAVHILSASKRFSSYIGHRRLPMGPADFAAHTVFAADADGDRQADVFVFHGRDNSGRSTAAHIATAKSGWTRFDMNRRLPDFGATATNRWAFSAGDFDGDHKADIIALDSQDNGGRNVAVHVVTAASGFTKSGLHQRTKNKGFNLASTPTFTAWKPGATGPTGPRDITIADLRAIYGSIPSEATVANGLPSLNAEMRRADITTPARKAAFLATIRNESGFRYNAEQRGATLPYRGRGFIQLTGEANYRGAGNHLNHNFVARPQDAASLQYSAAIARYYWTVARNINSKADRLDMGAVNDAIGYRPEAAEDAERCADFKAALRYFTGSVPGGINCVRR